MPLPRYRDTYTFIVDSITINHYRGLRRGPLANPTGRGRRRAIV